MVVRRPTFLYDGDCAFCSSCARFIARWMRTRADVVAWQHADLGALGVSAQQAEDAVQWVDSRGVAAGPEGIARLLEDSGPIWRPVGWVLGRRPLLRAAWPVYRWVSRNRHRLPGGTAVCSLPQAERERLQRDTS